MPQNIITIAKAINVSNISRVMVIIPHFSYTFGHRGNKLVTNRYLLSMMKLVAAFMDVIAIVQANLNCLAVPHVPTATHAA